ncbi:tetratricopeptide repeat protein [Arthrobacter sp. GCM10027362]|uniref:tetratricopeptide repeat protein n=1 Tax=Arthrobacter sp. GCM10027362 TaxID=3273379 RepID=UPI003642CAC6
MGKTQLAVSIFEDPANADVDLRLWVRAESRTSVVTAFAEAADRVQAPVPEGADADQKAAAFLSWLSVTDRSWLVVFDNANDPGQLSGLWPGGPGRVLATTYRRDAALVIGAGTTVRLGVFTPEEAWAYMERRVRDAERNGTGTAAGVLDGAGELARDLGFLPVALAQAVSVILHQAIRSSDYLADFTDRANRLAELFPDRLPADEYERTVATTWSLAMEQAGTLPPAGLANRMVRLAAVTDPAGAPEAMFLAEPSLIFLAGAPPPKESGDVSSSSVSAAQARSALRDLHSLSLIEHQSGSPATVRMHALTQRAVRESITAPEFEDAVQVAADSLDAVWTASERDALALLLANTEHLISAANDALWNDRPHALLDRAGQSMLDAGMVAAATRHYKWLSEEATNRIGPDHPHTLTVRNNLALAYQEAGNPTRAIELLNQTLTDRERVLGTDHPHTLTSRNNLASAYQEAGNPTRAIELLNQTLTDAERVLGTDHPHTLTVRNNLALAYQEAGNPTRATELYEQTLTDTERVLGTDQPDTLTVRNNLALAYQEAGNPTRATELLNQTLTDRERVLGTDHPHTLTVRNNLASAYQEAGNPTRAIELYEQLLTDAERVLGTDHPHTLTVRNNLASAYQEAGNPTRATELYEQTLTDRERVLGTDHPHTLTVRNNLASAYREAGNPTRAIELLNQTLTDAERVLGTDHPHTLTVRNNLALAYKEAGNPTRATELYEQLLTDAERVLGTDHPHTLTVRNNLASAYREAGNLNKGLLPRVLLILAVVCAATVSGCLILTGLDLSIGRPVSSDLFIGGLIGMLAAVFWVSYIRSRRRRPGGGPR